MLCIFAASFLVVSLAMAGVILREGKGSLSHRYSVYGPPAYSIAFIIEEDDHDGPSRPAGVNSETDGDSCRFAPRQVYQLFPQNCDPSPTGPALAFINFHR